MLISFAWTAPALVFGAKTRTRRNWSPSHAKRYEFGQVVEAWDRLPRAGGQKIGDIQIVGELFQEFTRYMTEDDFHKEGLEFMEIHQMRIQGKTPREFFDNWKLANERVWVIDFRLLALTKAGKELKEKEERMLK